MLRGKNVGQQRAQQKVRRGEHDARFLSQLSVAHLVRAHAAFRTKTMILFLFRFRPLFEGQVARALEHVELHALRDSESHPFTLVQLCHERYLRLFFFLFFFLYLVGSVFLFLFYFHVEQKK